MRLILDPITILNALLCILILALGYLGFKKKKDRLSLSVGIAFGLFAVSHIISLLGLTRSFLNFFITIRMLAYFMVAFSLYKVVTRK